MCKCMTCWLLQTLSKLLLLPIVEKRSFQSTCNNSETSHCVVDDGCQCCVASYVDYVSIMSYDYYGPWSSVLGHNSPLYVPDQDRNSPGLNLLSQVSMLFCTDSLQLFICSCSFNLCQSTARNRSEIETKMH